MDGLNSPASYAEWLKQRRKALDLTQAELAQRAGCSVFALRKIESGERRPSKQLARLLAVALDVPSEDQETFTRVARGEIPLGRLDTPSLYIARTPAPALMPLPPNTLPGSLTPLLGREPELAALSRLLHDPLCRLLTLTGAGGIGKTRLAIEAASRHQALFAQGVCFVSLAPLKSPAFLVPAIARALGFAFHGQSDSRVQLVNYLRDHQMLLVLDNIEHLLDCVGLLVEILEAAPKVKLLVTSRTRLALQSEWVFVIQGLPVPPADAAARAEEYTSVQLFVQSARRARIDFALHEEDRAAVASICRLVEGMPLGIELAAAWVSVLTCREIALEIERSLDFLATANRDIPDRQRSLRAVFDHSWDLLDPEERIVLRRLGIFQGGFRRNAAEMVASATLASIYALTAKSLLQHNEGGRYDLHEVVRQYASARFEQDPERELIHHRHSQFYLALLRDREPDLKGPAQRDAIQELKDEIDNVRAAWAWAVEHQEFAPIGEALRSFGWLCNVGVLYREGIEQLELLVRALRAQPETPERQRVLGMALAQQGLLCFRQGQLDRALRLDEEALTVLRPLCEPSLLPDALVISGVILHLYGEFERAKARMEEGLDCARTGRNRSYEAYALYNLGYLASLEGDYDQGYEQMLTGLAQWRELGDPSSIALGLNYISPTAIHLGRIDEARAYLQESLTLLTQVGDRWGMGTAYRLLGVVSLAQGNTGAAQTYLHRSLDFFSGYITGWDIARSLIYLAEAAIAAGDPTNATRIFFQALASLKDEQATPLFLDIFLGLAQLQMQTGQAETALGLARFVLDHPAAPHEAKERASRLCAQAEQSLMPPQVLSAHQWATKNSLETILELLPEIAC